MDLDPDYKPEFDLYKQLLLDMAQERSWEALLQLIGTRMLEIPHVVLVRLWLVLPGDLCSSCPMREVCPDQKACLHLVGSAGPRISRNGPSLERIEEDVRRIPLGVRKIGRVAANVKSITVSDMTRDSTGESSRAWAEARNIHGFSAFPLVYKGQVLGVSAEFTRIPLPQKGEEQVWGQILADHMAAAIANARAFDELKKVTVEKERIESELKFAKLVQEGFLPEKLPQHPHFEFAAKMVPAKFVGGDFYDFIPLKNNRLGMVLGDVSGKGVSAALYMARLLSDFRYLSQMDPDPVMVLKQINRILCERSRQGMFATAIFLLLEMDRCRLRIANAGHPPLLIRGPENRTIEKGRAGGVPLGILPNAEYLAEDIPLESGNLVFLFTDGATEAYNPKREHFGLSRLQQVLTHNTNSVTKLIGQLQAEIERFTHNAPQQDDLTFLTFKVL
ncbi:MAG: GAF domain-containing SpoIIE family protein phosphatase [Nitrospinaceae bacterium]